MGSTAAVRSGRPVVKVTLIPPVEVSKRIGIAKGKFIVPDDIDEMNNEIFYSVISIWEVSIKHTAAKNIPILVKNF